MCSGITEWRKSRDHRLECFSAKCNNSDLADYPLRLGDIYKMIIRAGNEWKLRTFSCYTNALQMDFPLNTEVISVLLNSALTSLPFSGMAIDVDPDQTAPEGFWSGSALFTCHFVSHLDVRNFRTFTVTMYFSHHRIIAPILGNFLVSCDTALHRICKSI